MHGLCDGVMFGPGFRGCCNRRGFQTRGYNAVYFFGLGDGRRGYGCAAGRYRSGRDSGRLSRSFWRRQGHGLFCDGGFRYSNWRVILK